MENLSYSSYAESGDSSPLSREIDENHSWDEPQPPPQPQPQPQLQPSNYKLKFLCSYGGKIQPRPHDNHLAYIGGDTKILAIDRSIKFTAFVNKLAALCGGEAANVCFKYQLPGEDLDALISVTNDEDLEHMMAEYDRMYRACAKPARLRLFLFNLKPSPQPAGEVKSEGQWFVDALNSVQVPSLDVSPPPAAAADGGNPDFLFGLDKGFPASATTKSIETPPPATEVMPADTLVKNQPIPELERQQIGRGEEQVIDEANSKAQSGGEYYSQKVPETVYQIPLQMPIPTPYLTERSVPAVGYPGAEPPQPVYLIQTASGVYNAPALRQVTGQVGSPGYYGVLPVYSPFPLPTASAALPPQQPMTLQVGYDSAGRQVYYAAAGATVAGGGGGGALNQDGKVVMSPPPPPPQTSSA